MALTSTDVVPSSKPSSPVAMALAPTIAAPLRTGAPVVAVSFEGWEDFEPLSQEDLTVEDIDALLGDPEIESSDRNLLLGFRLTFAAESAIAGCTHSFGQHPGHSRPRDPGVGSDRDTDGSGD